MKSITASVLMVFLFCTTGFALDTSYDTGKTQKHEKEQTQSMRRTQEKRKTKGKRKSTTSSTGVDKQAADTLKQLGQAMQSHGFEITVDLKGLFLDRIAELEKRSRRPFCDCKIATKPVLPRDIGLSAEIAPGVIDTIKAQYISQAAQYNAPVTDLADEQAVRHYIQCLSYYGALIGEAYLNLNHDLQALDALQKDKSGKITVSGIGYDDLCVLADGALKQAMVRIKNPYIQTLYSQAQRAKSECVLAGAPEKIRCGTVTLILGPVPQLDVLGVRFFSENTFAGFSATYRVNASWSYSDVLEALRSTTRYRKFAEDVAQYSERLVALGRAREAVMLKKKAFELAKTGKQVISPSRLIPGLGE